MKNNAGKPFLRDNMMTLNEKSWSAVNAILSMIRNEFGITISCRGLGRVIIATRGETLSISLDTSDEYLDYETLFATIYDQAEDIRDQGVVHLDPPDAEHQKMVCYCIRHNASMLMVAISNAAPSPHERETSAEKIFKHSLGNILHALLKDTSSSIPRCGLTPRQLECLKWVSRGKSDWEIGQLIKLSPHTVHRHIEAAKKRLNVATRVQAVVSAGLTHADELS